MHGRDGARGGGEMSVSTVSRYLASAPGTQLSSHWVTGHGWSGPVSRHSTPLHTEQAEDHWSSVPAGRGKYPLFAMAKIGLAKNEPQDIRGLNLK